MSYLVLARKYRPKTFSQVIGQQHITKTLKNSILSGRIAHSFLFTGPRGVGKTTTARILAKSLNCQNCSRGEPCNICDACQDITHGSSIDVLEIDGASNNSVDDIRDLRDKICYLPTVNRYKIYIIDEVHMLSTAAFNALLKTLEEPPRHAIFIFATTEPHKIPATILSRCQRYDFNRLSTKEIIDALQNLVRVEEQEISPQILSLIARSAEGSMRDAQSILDQVISCSEGAVQYDEVLYLLGLVKKNRIFSIWQSVFERKHKAILSGIAHVLERGYDIRYFTEQLLQYLRDLIIYKTCQNHDFLLDISEEEIELLKRQSDLVSLEDLQQYFRLLTQCLDRMRGASHAHIILEMTLIQLAEMESVSSLGEILQRLLTLEKVLQEKGALFAKEGAGEGRVSPEPSHSMNEPLYNEKSSEISPSPEEPYTAADAQSLSFLESRWAMVKEGIKKEKKTLIPILQKATINSFTDDSISLSFPESPPFYLDTIKQESNRLMIQKWVRKIFGPKYRIDYRAKKGLKPDKFLSSQEKDNCTNEHIDAIIGRYPIIKTVMETFSAQVIQSHVSFRHKD